MAADVEGAAALPHLFPAGARAVLGQIPIFLGQGGGSGEAGRRRALLEAIREEVSAAQ